MKNLMSYKSFFKNGIICIIAVTSGAGAFSQGAWNIKYMSLDSLNTSFIDKEIRIDFKRSNADSLNGEVNVLDIRRLLSVRDTVDLKINDKSQRFVEQWKFYVDHGDLSEQFLETANKSEKERIQIKEMFLKSINDSSLILEVVMYGSFGENKEQRKKQRLIVNKSVIKGLLVNISDE
jgi:hypothetical protein